MPQGLSTAASRLSPIDDYQHYLTHLLKSFVAGCYLCYSLVLPQAGCFTGTFDMAATHLARPWMERKLSSATWFFQGTTHCVSVNSHVAGSRVMGASTCTHQQGRPFKAATACTVPDTVLSTPRLAQCMCCVTARDGLYIGPQGFCFSCGSTLEGCCALQERFPSPGVSQSEAACYDVTS